MSAAENKTYGLQYKDLSLIFEAIKELFYEIDDIDIEEDPTRNMYFLSMKVYGKN